MSKIKIVIADDDLYTCRDVAATLNREIDMQVVGLVHHPTEIFAVLENTKPDVLILDVRGMNAVEILKTLRNQSDMPRVLILSVVGESWKIRQLLEAGATSYLLKDNPSLLTVAIRATAKGASMIGPKINKNLETPGNLTAGEIKVIGCFMHGLTSNKEIANVLLITAGTVKTHLSNIYRKTGVSSRSELLLWAIKNGLADNI